MRILNYDLATDIGDRVFAGKELRLLLALRQSPATNSMFAERYAEYKRSKEMNALTPMPEGHAPGDAIDGNYTVASEEIIHTFQATVSSMIEKLNSKPGTDRGLENIMVESPKADMPTAFFALRQYLVKRSAHAVTRQIFDLALRGVKPKTTRKGDRFTYEWYDEGNIVAAYQVILIEIA